jgi:hypothetical protein
MIFFNWRLILCLITVLTHVKFTFNIHAAASSPASLFAQKVSDSSAKGKCSPSIQPPCGKAFGIPSFFKNKTAKVGNSCPDSSEQTSDYSLPAAWNDNWESNNDLWIASRLGSVKDLESAISLGASVNAREAVLSRTAMHFAAERGHTSVILKLITAGADIDAKNEANFTVVDSSGIEVLASI